MIEIKTFLRICLASILTLAGAIHGGIVSAQDFFPARPIRLIVPAPPGGGTDTVARMVAKKLSTAVEQPVVVDNRAGASGILAARLVASASPDGYTLFVPFASHVTNPSLVKDLGFDPIEDFSPITRLSGLPYLLVVTPALPAKSVKDLIALAKKTSDGLTYASAGAGLTGHLAMELLKDLGDFQAVHVPYKGGAAATVDVAAGRVCCFFASAPSALPLVKAGRVRVIAVSTKERSALVPEVPTVAEQGYSDFDVVSWYGLLAPAGTPKKVVAFLHKEVVSVLKTADLKQQLAAVGAAPAPSASPDAFRSFLESEIKTWAKVIRKAGITAR